MGMALIPGDGLSIGLEMALRQTARALAAPMWLDIDIPELTAGGVFPVFRPAEGCSGGELIHFIAPAGVTPTVFAVAAERMVRFYADEADVEAALDAIAITVRPGFGIWERDERVSLRIGSEEELGAVPTIIADTVRVSAAGS